MKLLFNNFLILFAILFFNNINCRTTFSSRPSTMSFEGIYTTPARPKYLKKIKKYLGHFANPDFEKKICSIESIFIKNIAHKTAFGYFVRFIGKKHCKNGQTKQVAFLVYANDALRFLIKNRDNFHFSIKKDKRSLFGKNIALKMLQRSSA